MRLTLEYVAGLFDGEGNIWLNPRRHGQILSITNSNRQVLELVRRFFACGTIQHVKLKTGKFLHRWRICHHIPVNNILRRLLPYLVIKRKVAGRAIKYIARAKYRPVLDVEPTTIRRYHKSMSYKNIAKRLGVSVGTVWSRAHSK